MPIRYGYDITVTSKYPTPMLSLTAPRPQRSADVRSQDVVVTSPEVVKTTYLDLFGNVCRHFIAPSGDLQIWCTERSRIAVPMTQPFGRRRKIPVAELPDDCLVYLMGSRYCETG